MTTVVVAANGAAVRFNSADVSVTYNCTTTGATTIGQGTTTPANKTPIIYVPITNPADSTLMIKSIQVDFLGGGSTKGMVTDMWVYFGSTAVYNAGLDWTYVDTFTTTLSKSQRIEDAPSCGILVALQLNLPETSSTIDLYSVDVQFSS
ncbi:hypothetical protein HD806DRAFT_516379 [Xylariaceae sp. AK1471]|nr:hypothetical protein HD806DRAFT_516379 [Xylariaceae sp. AK1471]